ncbi:MAG: hypothetical protein DMF56_16200 [Acidobacteria bacterium]|nr:MAG: hypothetical protein DMF56_16200 [Acidobacteriota bacterium]
MNHVTQEEIVMAYYGERFAHLDDCEECRTELARIAAVLDRVDAPEVPEPDADYESRVWQRLEWRLRGEKKRERRREWIRWGAVAAVVALAFVAGLFWQRENRAVAPQSVSKPAQSPNQIVSQQQNQQRQRDRILLVVINEHFDDSERILVELSNLKPEEGLDIGPERARAEGLLASNRLYRRSAEDRGEENVATLLDDLEPVLMQIAHAPSQVSANELRAIQKRVEAKGLVLKLRVVRANVRGKTAASYQQPNV